MSTVAVNFHFDSLDAAIAFFAKINAAGGGATPVTADKVIEQPTSQPAATQPEQATPARRGRKPKAEAAPPSSTGGTSTAETPPAAPASAPESATPPAANKAAPSQEDAEPAGAADPSAPPTEADVRTWLMKVNDKHGASGLAKVSEIVTSVGGVPSIKMLKPEQYPAVIEAAKKELAK